MASRPAFAGQPSKNNHEYIVNIRNSIAVAGGPCVGTGWVGTASAGSAEPAFVPWPPGPLASGGLGPLMPWNFGYLYPPPHAPDNSGLPVQPFIRHGKGGNYAWLDGHVSFNTWAFVSAGKNGNLSW